MTSKDKTKSLVNKATTDDRNPPSGYLLKELAARTMQISECQTIEDLIVKKLAKNKPYIKYKALRVVKFLCETGSPNWRRAWQRNTDKLRDAQQFRGPPDPIYGDAPYQQVRKAAKDAMHAVFAQSAVDSAPIRNKIKGFGGDNQYSSNDSGSSFKPPSTFGSGSSGTFGGSSLHKKKAPSAPSVGGWGKQMPGHGNTNYTPSVDPKKFKPLSTNPYTNPANFSNSPSHSTGKLDTRGSGKKRNKGKVGGIWGADPEDDNSSSEPEQNYSQYEAEDTSYSNKSYSNPSSKRKAIGGSIKRTTSSGQYEKRWVDDIVKSGGVGCKIVDLPKFVSQFENLSKNHVLEYLDEKLEDSAWQKQGKALALIEALLTKGKSSDDVVEYFSQSPDNVQSLINSKKSILRKKAKAVMAHLDVEEDSEPDDGQYQQEPQVTVTAAVPQQEKSTGNLFDMDMGNGSNVTNGGDAGDDDDDGSDGLLFDGMEVKNEANTESNDLLSFTDNKQNAAASNLPDDDPIGIMNIMGDVTHCDVTATATAASTNTAQSEYKDPFGMLGGTGGTQPPPNTSTNASQSGGNNDLASFFGGGSGAKPAANGNTSTTTAASAFGFDLGNQAAAPTTAAATTGTTQSSGGASAFGFDLGGTGGGNQAAPKQATPQQQPMAQSSSMNSSAFGFDLGNSGGQKPVSSMMTAPIMAQNNQAQMNMMSQMNQMQQMQQMMRQMQMGQMNPQMMNQMQMNMMNTSMNNSMMQQQTQQQPNLFQQAMAGVGGHGQQQQPPQQSFRNSNDPFSGLTTGSGSQAAQTQQAPTQPPKPSGPDPFAQFGLNSMQ